MFEGAKKYFSRKIEETSKAEHKNVPTIRVLQCVK
jgi:hypothetical protein